MDNDTDKPLERVYKLPITNNKHLPSKVALKKKYNGLYGTVVGQRINSGWYIPKNFGR